MVSHVSQECAVCHFVIGVKRGMDKWVMYRIYSYFYTIGSKGESYDS